MSEAYQYLYMGKESQGAPLVKFVYYPECKCGEMSRGPKGGNCGRCGKAILEKLEEDD